MKYNFADKITIGEHEISEQHPVFFIAEGGVNHNGDVEQGKQLVQAAAKAGASAIKFQMFHPDELILKDVEKAGYQQNISGAGSQYEMLQKLSLPIEQMAKLKDAALSEGLAFICTPFDSISLNELQDLGVDAIKIASTDTTNIPFLREIARTAPPVILSTAMSYWSEIERAVAVFTEAGKRNVAVLQCTGNYPAPQEEANLNVMHAFSNTFECLVGLSDHSIGPTVAGLAVAAGAKIIEKHLTLDKELHGPDHRASAEPEELAAVISHIRQVELILGRPEKMLSPSEIANRSSLQKSIVAVREIPTGERISMDDVKIIRAGGKGVSPIYWDEVAQMRVHKTIEAGNIVHWEDLTW